MSSDLSTLFAEALDERGEDAGGADAPILDAALAEVAEHGERGATIDAIASRAGVGRITVFRRFGSKDRLLARLTLRELRAFLESVDRALEPIADPGERVAEAFVRCVRAGRTHPLIARAARTDPGRTMESLAAGRPSPLDIGRAFVASRVSAAQAEGELPAHDPDVVADVLVRLAVSYVFLPSGPVDPGDEDAARSFARSVLAPVVTRPPAARADE